MFSHCGFNVIEKLCSCNKHTVVIKVTTKTEFWVAVII